MKDCLCMKSVKLDDRLLFAAEYVTPNGIAADIGTDHAYLPCYLVQNGISKRCLACDLREGPLKKAAQTVDECGLQRDIKLLMCDGLSGLDENDRAELTDIIIAGMGGETIITILQNAEWVKDVRYNFIFQPMTKAHTLRRYLCENGFEIADETAVVAANKHYTVMNVHFSGKAAECDCEFAYIGRLSAKNDAAAVEYKRMIANKLKKAAQGMMNNEQLAQKAREYADCADKIYRETGIKQA